MKNYLKKGFIALSSIGTTAVCYGTALANSSVSQPSQLGKFQGKSIEEIAILIIIYALGISGLVAVVFLIMGGFQYITAQGNEEQTKKATATLLNAVIGIIIIFAAFAIVYTVQNNIIGAPSDVVIN